MREGALDGSIERLLEWHPVEAGDFFYIPANTVHAIGAGVSLIEVQQNSDVTYRLFDYGRPRELHLDQAVAVARGEPYAAALRSYVPAGVACRLVEGPLFRLDQITGAGFETIASDYAGAPFLLIPRDASAEVDGQTVEPGGCVLVGKGEAMTLAPDGTYLLSQTI